MHSSQGKLLILQKPREMRNGQATLDGHPSSMRRTLPHPGLTKLSEAWMVADDFLARAKLALKNQMTSLNTATPQMNMQPSQPFFKARHFGGRRSRVPCSDFAINIIKSRPYPTMWFALRGQSQLNWQLSLLFCSFTFICYREMLTTALRMPHLGSICYARAYRLKAVQGHSHMWVTLPTKQVSIGLA